MLEGYAAVHRIVLACGTVDLRKGIDGLAMIIRDGYGQNPFEKGTLFLFCGRRSDRIKGLFWMGTGFCLLYTCVLRLVPFPGRAPQRRRQNLQKNNSGILCWG